MEDLLKSTEKPTENVAVTKEENEATLGGIISSDDN